MDTNELKKFAQAARRQLMAAVATRLEQVLRTDSAEIREMGSIVDKLKQAIKEESRDHVVESAAYTWFNRFCALRFMDVNGYTPLGVVSSLEGFTQPEILQDAKKGLVDAEFNKIDKQRVFGLLNGQIPSVNPQQEAYRWLLVGACNSYYERMPFLFPQIDDYTALLMPADLLSEESILAGIREALTAETCKDVEIIGWLYQFYISEKKDQVMARKSAVPKEDIPAVTQLFTPHWIVRYLVENSLGRLWMLNHPDSRMVEQMGYFIKPDQQEADFIRVNAPEEIKICDPACGSGHMLTYAFDLLAAMYAEQGYDPQKIPSLIIKNNLFGIEIDERAGQLAAFALMMKAREKDKRFFTRKINPNICVMEDISFSTGDIKTYMDKIGSDLFTQELWFGLQQFEDAKTFGSLICPQIRNPQEVLRRMEGKGAFEDLFLFEINRKVKKVLEMVEFLNPHYHVVVTNPPYMGGKGFNDELRIFLRDYYPDVKSDLFSSFVIRCSELALRSAEIGIMSPNVWMYISSYEKLRKYLINEKTLNNLVELPLSGFKGATVQICAYIFNNTLKIGTKGNFIKLVNFSGGDSEMAEKTLEAIANPDCGWFYRVLAQDFNKIPGSPIAYSVSKQFLDIFSKGIPLGDIAEPRLGMATGNNDIYLRRWYEVPIRKIGLSVSNREEGRKSLKKWFPYNKGGDFRLWYGNNDYVVNWENDGYLLQTTPAPDGSRIWAHNFNLDYIFRPAITWTFISSSKFGVRLAQKGFLFDVAGSPAFSKEEFLKPLTAFLGSKVAFEFLKSLNPTLNFQAGNIVDLPIIKIDSSEFRNEVEKTFDQIYSISKLDWDSHEISWDFNEYPLIKHLSHDFSLKMTFLNLHRLWQQEVAEMKRLEEEINRIFIDAYGLQDELKADVPLEEVTLTCNPRYRYSGRKSAAELEALLLADTMKEFISYAVGCTFGRYSLDKPGLILANQGETLQDYLNQIPQPKFIPDKDNVLPILEGEWFADDIVSRFREFLKVTFGETYFDENLSFLENAIGRDIRSYFLRDFYSEHVKMYKKRPIYWLFSSPKGSFNALIYMHRYTPDTVSIVLNQYLIPYREKLAARKSHLQMISQNGNAGSAEKNRALKEINHINAVLLELREYEDEILYPLARERVAIDLDDGVKVNYAKFGKALKYVSGLSE